jgi:hypothetical protein
LEGRFDMADGGGGWQDLGISLPLVAAGFAGGMVNALFFKRTDPWAFVASLVGGALTANYLGPVVSHVIGDYVGTGGAAFIVGVTAMAICQGLVAAAKNWKFTPGGNAPGGGT